MIGKRLVNTGEAAAPFDALQNFEVVTYTGTGTTQKITGYIRKGAAFNGSSSYILTSGDYPIQGGQAHSVSFWVNFNSTSAQFLYGIGDTVTAFTHTSLRFDTSLTRAYLDNNGGAYIYSTSLSLSTGTWYYITHTYDGSGTSELFIDGTSVGTQSVTLNIDGALVIGRRPYYGSDYFNGKIDQFRVFNKEVSSSEITTLYGETYASDTKSTTDIFGDGSGVALYELDEDANVSASYGSGAIDSGQSADFYGTNSKIVTGSSILSTGDVAISAWVKFDTTSGVQPIICRDDVGSNRRLQLRNYNGTINAYWFHSGGLSALDSNKTVVANQWYHITSVFSENNYNRLYINGVLDAEDTSSIGTRSAIDFLNLGFLDTGDYLNGKIDDVRIYSSTLTSSEIGYIVSNDIVNIPTANLVAHYKLDGNANDETTNYNGTATNVGYTTPAEIPSHPYNGTSTSVNFLGMAFQPDLVWIKQRTGTANNHQLYNSVTDATVSNTRLYPNLTNAQTADPNGVTALNSNGFTLGNSGNVNDGSSTFVAWSWKAGDSVVTDSTTGTLTADISANTDAGFSIVNYTGNQTSGATFPHGLDSAAEMVIIKNKSASTYWFVYHKDLDTNKNVYLNTSDSQQADNQMFGAGANVVTVGSSTSVNSSTTDSMIAYCFHSVDGYQKVGSYTGNASSINTISVGFAPRFVLFKRADSTGSWRMFDSTRGTDKSITANSNGAEYDDTQNYVDFTSDGFEFNRTVSQTNPDLNSTGGTYIYLAIA